MSRSSSVQSGSKTTESEDSGGTGICGVQVQEKRSSRSKSSKQEDGSLSKEEIRRMRHRSAQKKYKQKLLKEQLELKATAEGATEEVRALHDELNKKTVLIEEMRSILAMQSEELNLLRNKVDYWMRKAGVSPVHNEFQEADRRIQEVLGRYNTPPLNESRYIHTQSQNMSMDGSIKDERDREYNDGAYITGRGSSETETTVPTESRQNSPSSRSSSTPIYGVIKNEPIDVKTAVASAVPLVPSLVQRNDSQALYRTASNYELEDGDDGPTPVLMPVPKRNRNDTKKLRRLPVPHQTQPPMQNHAPFSNTISYSPFEAQTDNYPLLPEYGLFDDDFFGDPSNDFGFKSAPKYGALYSSAPDSKFSNFDYLDNLGNENYEYDMGNVLGEKPAKRLKKRYATTEQGKAASGRVETKKNRPKLGTIREVEEEPEKHRLNLQEPFYPANMGNYATTPN